MLKVFLSSTSADLSMHREVVYKAISSLEGYHCVRMEDFGTYDAQPADLCRQKVGNCDLYIGILGLFHGSCPSRSAPSFTEIEYQAAIDFERPRLVFLTPDDFPVKGNLRESDEKWRRQQAFRERASEDRVRVTFTSPEDLARAVVTAIHNWDRNRPRTEASPATAETIPDLGALVCKMCDRKPQEDQFKAHFFSTSRKRPGLPQIYVVCGEERECPESLVERLTKTYVRRYASSVAGQHKGVVAQGCVSWPEEGELAERYQRLIASLFELLDPQYAMMHEDLSPAAFASLEFLAAHPVFVLEHAIRPARGNLATQELLERYLGFWDEVALHQPKTLIVAFLWVLYPMQGNRWIIPWPRRERFDRDAFKEALAELHQKRKEHTRLSPCLPLEELTCVKRDHFLEWLQIHQKVYDTKIRLEKCAELFGENDCMPMANVEHALAKIQSSSLYRRE